MIALSAHYFYLYDVTFTYYHACSDAQLIKYNYFLVFMNIYQTVYKVTYHQDQAQ